MSRSHSIGSLVFDTKMCHSAKGTCESVDCFLGLMTPISASINSLCNCIIHTAIAPTRQPGVAINQSHLIQSHQSQKCVKCQH